MKPTNNDAAIETKDWFDKFIEKMAHHIRTDELQINAGVATKETEDFYRSLQEGDSSQLAITVKQSVTTLLVRKIVVDYVKELASLVKDRSALKELAFDYNDSTVFVWAELADDDEITEENLIRAEAVVNARNLETGFSISSTIVEASDCVPVPNHYNSIMD